MEDPTDEKALGRRVEAAALWLEMLLQQDISQQDFFENLKDGVLLCKAMNVISPNSIQSINTRLDSFAKFSNANNFLRAAESFGVNHSFLFKAADLVTAKNKMKTLQTIFMLSYVAEKKQLPLAFIDSSDMKTVSKWVPSSQEPILAELPSPTIRTSLDSPISVTDSMESLSSPFTPGSIEVKIEKDKKKKGKEDKSGQASKTEKAENIQMAENSTQSGQETSHKTEKVEKGIAAKFNGQLIPVVSKLEQLEFLNKTLNIKMGEMMEGMLQAFQLMSGRIAQLEAQNQILLKRSEDAEQIHQKVLKFLEQQVSVNSSGAAISTTLAVSNPVPLAAGPTIAEGGKLRPRAQTAGSIGSFDSADANSDDSNDELPKTSTRENNRPRSRSILRKKKSEDSSGLKHSSSVESLEDIISAPVAHTTIKRARWYETEAGAGVDISQLSKMEIQRQDAIYELIDSESDYVKDLQVVMDVHMKKFRESNLLSERDMSTLFANLPQLLSVNRELCELFQQRRKQSPIINEVGDVFIKLHEYFKVYTVYCANHGAAGRLLSKLASSNEEFKKLLDYCTNEVMETRHLTLESYLIKPVQRICKYPLLLREIIKNTPQDHPDYANSQIAQEKIEAVLQIINERTQLADESQRILLLQSRIESPEPLELLHPSRRLYQDGMLQKLVPGRKAKERYLVLFNDQLLICKPLAFTKNRYQLQKAIPAGLFLVNPYVEPSDKAFKYAFQLIHSGVEKLEFACQSEEEKNVWIKHFEMAIAGAMKKPTHSSTNSKDLSIPEKSSSPTPIENTRNSTSKALKLLGLDETTGNAPPPPIAPSKGKISKRVSTAFDESSLGPPKMNTGRRASVQLDSLPHRPSLPDPETVENITEEIWITLREYNANSEYEISFAQDQQLLVVNRRRDDYWKVQMKDVIGFVYSGHVKPAEDIVGKATVIEQLKKIPNHNISSCSAYMDKKKSKLGFTLARKKKDETKGSVTDIRSALLAASSPVAVSSVPSSVMSSTSNYSSDSSSIKTNKTRMVVSKEGYKAAGRIWRKVTNSDDSFYYYCPDSYETCLVLPSGAEFEDPFFSWIEEPVVDYPGMVEIDVNGLTYYCNKETRETLWSLPLVDDREAV